MQFSEGDIAKLFREEKDPVEIIRWNGIYEGKGRIGCMRTSGRFSRRSE